MWRIDILFLIAVLLFSSNACSLREKSQYHVIQFDEATFDSLRIVSTKLNIDLGARYSSSSPLRANEKGVIITPFSPIGDTVAFYTPHDIMSCCIKKNLLIRKGFGPGELDFSMANASSLNKDTLVFYSRSEAKFIYFDKKMNLILEHSHFEPQYNINEQFTLTRGGILASLKPQYNNEELLRFDKLWSNEEPIRSFSTRVPAGYQPQIRNHLSTMITLPNGIAFSFVGDKEIIFLDKDLDLYKKLKLGPNEPLEEFTKTGPNNYGAKSIAYIPKIEYSNSKLYVLYENKILVFSYPSLKPIKKVIISNDVDKKGFIITDFIIYEDLLYVVFNANEIHQLNIDYEWHN